MVGQHVSYKNLKLLLVEKAKKKLLLTKPSFFKDLRRALECFHTFWPAMDKNEIQMHLTLCGVSKIKSLNKKYRKIDKVTDVLSFPLHEDLYPYVGRSRKSFQPVLDLGDIFICREVAARQAENFGRSYQEEVIYLLIHSFLHLLGFDHAT
ncbi:MAG: rRNA maturation RNase YbeY, partial [Pseudomonadota bacterium]